MLLEFISANWDSVVLSLITAGALGYCRYIFKRAKEYQAIIEEHERQALTKAIDEEIDKQIVPVVNDIEELRDYIRRNSEEGNELNRQMRLIVSSYRFRLVQLCRIYLKQGYLTVDQFEQLTEFYNLYESLGGNGQAEDFYRRTIALPRKDSE